MKVGSTYSFFFSPTGGTKRVASLFGYLGDGNAEDITSSCDDICLGADDFAVFSVPSYGGRIPSPVYERMSHINGSGTPCVVIAVFGNRAVDDAGLEMSNLVSERGFKVIGYGEFVAPHSVNKKFASDRPDENDIEKINEFKSAVESKLLSGSLSEVHVPGNPVYKDYGGIPLKPVTSRKCTACGKCASFCPAGAISVDKTSTTDKSVCISCMGCIEICPVKARRIPSAMKAAASASLKNLCSGRKDTLYIV